ncbi:unnamed protein product [Wuchereria bancrofti]|uniref:Reverse transcriptase domain-containing protein n=1 Tax=Wuchereria bancrofti TaxID=6293 RepID=A0A3P7FWQ5_WUCBA|nr:unnamed protein product [Wuchereria bancrofti]
MGIKEDEVKEEDIIAQEHFDRNVHTNEEGRIVVSFPWRPKQDNLRPLSDNFALSSARLYSQWNKLQSKPELISRYHQTIQNHIANGIIEPTTRQHNNEYFLPHQPIWNENSISTKLRVVFDASAKLQGQSSLNEYILRGPVILPQLLGVVMRWRLPPIAIIADIEKAFHQLTLHIDDRKFTKFLWLKDISRPPTTTNLAIFQFARLPFGIICSPFLLAAAIRYALQKRNTSLAKELESNMYVDNILLTAQNLKEAHHKYELTKQYFASIKMNLRQLKSNKEDFNNSLPNEDLLSGTTVKMLGILWNIHTDQIILKLKELPKATTKRTILSAVTSVFDPLGWISPVLIPFKTFLQELWRDKLSWDEPLSVERLSEWNKLSQSWTQETFLLIRHIKIEETSSIHIFADASAKAYGAVAYLLTPGQTAKLWLAKTRLAPLKATTIPRLELLAVLIATRLAVTIRKELQRKNLPITVWSDSQIVLCWLFSSTRQPRFVENRLKECRQANVSFQHVPTRENPADTLSRGMSPAELKTATLWWNGPTWLSNGENIPAWIPPIQSLSKDNNETQAQQDQESVLTVAQTLRTPHPLSTLLEIQKFGSWKNLISTISQIYRAADRMLKKKELTSCEYWQKAIHFVIQKDQQLLADYNQHVTQTDKTGIIRYVSRMENMDNIENHPALLDRHSPIVPLLEEEQYLVFYITVNVVNGGELIHFRYLNFHPFQ